MIDKVNNSINSTDNVTTLKTQLTASSSNNPDTYTMVLASLNAAILSASALGAAQAARCSGVANYVDNLTTIAANNTDSTNTDQAKRRTKAENCIEQVKTKVQAYNQAIEDASRGMESLSAIVSTILSIAQQAPGYIFK